MQQSITFTTMLWRINTKSSYVVTVPQAFVESQLLTRGKKYKITIQEVEQ